MSGFNNPFPFPLPPEITPGPQDPAALPSAIGGIPGVPGPPPPGPVDRIMQAAGDPRLRAYMSGVAQSIGQGYRPGSSPFENIIRALGSGTQSLNQEGHTQRQLANREGAVGAQIDQGEQRIRQGDERIDQDVSRQADNNKRWAEQLEMAREKQGIDLEAAKLSIEAAKQRMAQDAELFPAEKKQKIQQIEKDMQLIELNDQKLAQGIATDADIRETVAAQSRLATAKADLAEFQVEKAPETFQLDKDKAEASVSNANNYSAAALANARAAETRANAATDPARGRINQAKIIQKLDKDFDKQIKTLDEADFGRGVDEVMQVAPNARDLYRRMQSDYVTGNDIRVVRPITAAKMDQLIAGGAVDDSVRYLIVDAVDDAGNLSAQFYDTEE